MYRKLNKYLDSEQQNLTLSQKAIMFINALDEISSTLVGMRRVEYVKNILSCMTLHSDTNLKKYW
jgi:aryl-alcohol dehydrogenase-like predicted oxidoreductase